MTSPVRRLLAFTCGLSLFLGCEFTPDITVPVGENVTLECFFKAETLPYMQILCWGRESFELFDHCNNEMVRSNGNVMISTSPQRYHFSGNLARGDASVTILNVSEKDSGTYVCAVIAPTINYEFFVVMAVEVVGSSQKETTIVVTTPPTVNVSTPAGNNDTKSAGSIAVASIVTAVALVMLAVVLVGTWYIKTRTGRVDFVETSYWKMAFWAALGTVPDGVATGHEKGVEIIKIN